VRGLATLAALAALAAGPARADVWPLDRAPASLLGHEAGAGAARIAAAGDLDLDGVLDIAVGAPLSDEFGQDAGQVYLLLGGDLHRNQPLDDATWVIGGADPDALLGWSVVAPGDVNGDGFADLAVGAPLQRTGDASGTVYLFLGPATAWPDTLDVADADVVVEGEQLSSGLGAAMAPAGDVDADGYDDLWLAAPYTHMGEDDPLTVELDEFKLGRVYLLLGRASWAPTVRLPDDAHLWVSGVAEAGMLGLSVAGGQDISGDGVPDMCAGAPNAVVEGDDAVGVIYCYTVVGSMGPGGYLASDAARFRVVGLEAGDMAGTSIAMADVTGDGIHDLVAGAPYVSITESFAGAVTAYAGGAWLPVGASPWGAGIFEVSGSQANGAFGYRVAAAGDLMGTGYDEVLISSPGAGFEGTATGLVHVLPGREIGGPWPVDSEGLTFIFEGEFDTGRAGTHLAALGDQGLETATVAIGGLHVGHGGDEAGKSWIAHLGLDTDADGDGFTELEGDCRDGDPDSFPGAAADPARDDDCDGWDEDGGDCDDGCADCFPGAPEIADDLDNDCDGDVDEVDVTGTDDDGDGWTVEDGDCDDTDPEIFPGAVEQCNGADDNCNGVLDDGACGDDDDSAGPVADDDDDSAAIPGEEGCGSCAAGDRPHGRPADAAALVVLLVALSLLRRRS